MFTVVCTKCDQYNNKTVYIKQINFIVQVGYMFQPLKGHHQAFHFESWHQNAMYIIGGPH